MIMRVLFLYYPPPLAYQLLALTPSNPSLLIPISSLYNKAMVWAHTSNHDINVNSPLSISGVQNIVSTNKSMQTSFQSRKKEPTYKNQCLEWMACTSLSIKSIGTCKTIALQHKMLQAGQPNNIGQHATYVTITVVKFDLLTQFTDVLLTTLPNY